MGAKRKNKISIKEAGGVGNWLNARLFPYLGPPPLGVVDRRPPEERAAEALTHACPLCGEAMSLHEVDRTGERTQLYCPKDSAAELE